MTLPVRIRPVEGRKELRRFVTMPARALWRRPVLGPAADRSSACSIWTPSKNPFLSELEIAYWLAFRGAACVGRISAQVDRAHLARHGDGTGHFGFFETIDDVAVAGALIDTAADWLRQRGLNRLAGPFSLSINDECGLLVTGFDTPPNMMMGHHRPYYARILEELGFTKAKDLVCYHFDVMADLPAPAQRLFARLRTLPGLRVRPIDFRRFEAELETLRDIFNDAWTNNWGFIPFTPDQMRHLGKSMRPLISADWVAIGELDGEPAAMVVTLPNLNEAIHDLGGRLLPFGWAKLLWRLKVEGVRSGRMPLLGVRRKYQGSAKGAALALGVIERVRDHHRAHGTRSAELSWILEDNKPIRDIVEALGGRPYKTYRIYERAIA